VDADSDKLDDDDAKAPPLSVTTVVVFFLAEWATKPDCHRHVCRARFDRAQWWLAPRWA
jgi:hypothetical protein